MMIWDDFVKKEELETAPGVIDGELVQALMINTYPTYIREIIDTGENLFPEETAEQLETAMEMTFMSYIHTFEGRYPTPNEKKMLKSCARGSTRMAGCAICCPRAHRG